MLFLANTIYSKDTYSFCFLSSQVQQNHTYLQQEAHSLVKHHKNYDTNTDHLV